jgi:hypothetical protein
VSQVPLPDPDFAPTRPFFEAAERGELAIPRCEGCRRLVWYPQETCPRCGGAELVWRPQSGRGTLYSYAVVQRALWKPFADKVPYVTGLVALEEDPEVRVVTTLVDWTPEELHVDLPVEAVFRPLRFAGSERSAVVPFFRPRPLSARPRA